MTDVAQRLAVAEARIDNLRQLRDIDGALGIARCRLIVARYLSECSERRYEEELAREAGVTCADPEPWRIRREILVAVSRDLADVTVSYGVAP